ncbi:HNH endonuclease signature motif containing protein [Streptomyces sp. NPDC051211]|uniref:HNH endonuclease signature motif containing protein n=1 Tax=Streptomyces sp. NPDC051211 TaxID=3154643 RepID=UPI003450695D
MTKPRFTRDVLSRTAADSTSLVDLMRRLETPLLSGPFRYLRARLAYYGIDTSHFSDEPLPARARQRYTKERLREAAAAADSIAGMLAHMGIEPYNSVYVHLQTLLDKFGIDTSHFAAPRGGSERVFTREELTAAVAASHGPAGVIRALGRKPGDGATRVKVKRSIEEYGLSTDHFLGQGHGAGRPSPTRKPADEIVRRIPPGASRTSTALLRRALDDLRVPPQCAECGTGESWRGRRLVLEIDHINGDRLDNRRENLRYLCPSCHSQTPTFGKRSRLAIPSQRASVDQ